jgi:putative exosortase-associated protein (TIGR04073 family)
MAGGKIAVCLFKKNPASVHERMKILLSLALVTFVTATALADIHDPPMNDQGPTRKLGRGLANIAFGATEIPSAMCEMNEREGNAALWSYGAVRGIGRFFARLGYGIYEVTTFPFPTTRASYRPPYKSNIPWIHGGYEEFPPELGFHTRYRYTRGYYTYE